MKFRDPKRDINDSEKIAWIIKQSSSEMPKTHMRLATPRPTGKLPGMGGIAKNPFNSLQKIKVPNPPTIKSVKVASGTVLTRILKTAGYSHDYYMKNRQKIKQRNKQYRMANSAQLRMARQRYQREISSGARRKAKRIRSGASYITYGGF